MVDPALLVLSVQGTTISGGVQGQPLLTAVDATYPKGYVGFGAAEDAAAVFDWVRMTGE